ncbi:hypothetical protein [Actinokineospora sp.]|uniref:hypothetical protein n=1 Tax=Actinokineospora sp. TaxID=1872133 RepID=UPI003D6B35BA
MSDAPRRDEPFRFTEGQPEPEPAPAMTWAMRILGLVAVAVLSGVVYWYTNDEPAGGAGPQQTTPAAREGVYDFAVHPQVPSPRTDTDCPGHAYGKTKTLLAGPGVCTKLIQAAYTTKADGREVLITVSVLHLSSQEKALELQTLTRQNNTGNVSDLVLQKVIKVDGLDSLAKGGGYQSRVDGSVITIVEGDFTKSGAKDEKTLDAVCEDALRLGEKIDQSS